MENSDQATKQVTKCAMSNPSYMERANTGLNYDGGCPNEGMLWNSTWQPSVRQLNSCAGGQVGSFSELMISATAGMMRFDVNGVAGNIFSAQHGAPDTVPAMGAEAMGAEAAYDCASDKFADDAHDMGENNADTPSGDDDGCLGGDEGDDDSDSDTSDDEACLGGHEAGQNANYGSNQTSDDNTDSDSSDHEEGHDREMEKGTTSQLGDCGCVTGEDHDDIPDVDEDLFLDSSDSEEEVTVEVDLAQEFYIDKSQEGVPYRKRKRVPKGWNRPNCRTPRAMGAVERALRSATKNNVGRVFEPKLGMVFDSTTEAKDFYNMYGWEVGFGVKFNSSRPTGGRAAKRGDDDSAENYISMQEIVCQRSGYDSRITTGTKRCGCPAKIRLLRTEDYGWYISTFVKDHNHEFSRTMGDKREWTSHRNIEPCMKEMIKNLRHNNVPLTRVHCILGDMYGSQGDVPWTKRSLRTICNQIAKDQMNDDIRKTMEIFREMHEGDPGFQFSVELDKQSRVKTLLWCSGRSREQYACFGDVVTFDTTYCTNIYKMPFGLFVGVNHHFQTTIFAGVLMRRETARSFRWVFSEFLKLMGGKAPLTILTDQCKAMAKALRFVMPDTYHLWCKWHVMKKIRECLGPLYTKNKKFRDEFWLVVNGMLTEDEFEAAWADLVKRYHLETNGFMNRIYKSKRKWAKPWSKDKFCARMSSTQRSESANCMLKRFVPRNSSMNHFVSQFNRMLHDREREEDIAEHKTTQLKMVHSRLWSIERHALSIYTKAVFELFRSELDKASNYRADEIEGGAYIVTHDDAEKRAQWARVRFKVQVLDGGKRYVCECGLYEHFGILCCHVIRLLLNDRIPDAHIMKRWTRDARDVLPPELKAYQKDHSSMQSNTFRHRLLQLQSVKLQAKGDTDIEMFDIVMKHMRAAEKEADELAAKRLQNPEPEPNDDSTDEDGVGGTNEELAVQSDGGMLKNKKVVVRSGAAHIKHTCTARTGSGRVNNNRYGASGSSAHYSDSEIVGMKAPYFKRPAHRPRNNRFHAGSETRKKKWLKAQKGNGGSKDSEGQLENGVGADGGDGSKTKKGSKREIKCGKCRLKGHKAKQCCNLPITEDTAAAYL